MDDSIAMVTVVFESEVQLLGLQARSMARFLPPDLVSEILVIDNTRSGLPASARNALQAHYQQLRPLLRFVRPDSICQVPSTTGWRSQQVLKLAVARSLAADRYVLLDAKNHFVAAPDPGFFQAPDGRARANVYSYRTHPLRPAFENVMRYLGLPAEKYLDRFTATVTPFVLDTAVVLAMMADIERRSGRSFADEFVANQLLEFFLYSGWLVSTGQSLESFFDIHQIFCPTVWPKSATPVGVRAAIAQAGQSGAPVFSVHRKALAALDPEAIGILSTFWVDRGLFGSESEGRQFVADFTAEFRRSDRKRKWHELPLRLRSMGESAAGRLGRRPAATRTAGRPLPGEPRR